MKALYKIILFLAIFWIAPIIINSFNIFPYTFYSDLDTEEWEGMGIVEVITYLFTPQEGSALAVAMGSFTMAQLVGLFTVGGIIVAWATHSFVPVVISIIGLAFIPMVTTSYNFFNRLFTNWDIPSVTYLGLAIGVGVFIIAVITIVETPSHGRSG